MIQEKLEEKKVNGADAAEPALYEDLAKFKSLVDEYLAGWKRAKADYANLKKESERAAGEAAAFAAAQVMLELLPVLDSFKKAFLHQPNFSEGQESAAKQWAQGIAQIRQQFESALAARGVTAVEEEGVPFDPAFHEAVMQEKREGAEPGMVVRVLESGYKLHDKVLRPAKVAVAE